MSDQKKLEIVKKYYVRKEDGEIDYSEGYDFIDEKPSSKGLYYVLQNGHVGYMDANGKLVIPFKYDCTRTTFQGETRHHFSSWDLISGTDISITKVYKNNLVGAINHLGQEVVPCEFEDVNTFSFSTSKEFIPVALPSSDNAKFVWGLYDMKEKRICVTPKYEEVKQEYNGYASVRQNGKWGLVHCKTGTEVVKPIYLLDFTVNSSGIAIAFLGGTYDGRYVNSENCHVIVVAGSSKASVIISGYKWIEFSGPNVVKCHIRTSVSKEFDSFKIVKMPDHIVLIKNALYQSGYFLAKTGELVEKWVSGCTTYEKQLHAKYLYGGTFLGKTYDGKDFNVLCPERVAILEEL